MNGANATWGGCTTTRLGSWTFSDVRTGTEMAESPDKSLLMASFYQVSVATVVSAIISIFCACCNMSVFPNLHNCQEGSSECPNLYQFFLFIFFRLWIILFDRIYRNMYLAEYWTYYVLSSVSIILGSVSFSYSLYWWIKLYFGSILVIWFIATSLN